MPQDGLGITELVAAATDILEGGGYSRVQPEIDLDEAATERIRFFEDPYSIAAVSVFGTWDELAERWANDQSLLVDVLSKYLSKGDAKSWDGYLILLTPGRAASETAQQAAVDIRYNTRRVRKIVATGSELRDLPDVQRTLLPLLPMKLAVEPDEIPASALDRLPSMLADHGIPEPTTRGLVAAFQDGRPLLRALHEERS